ncbi:hypothetical protein DHEL01_v208405 [Diaporthe helianthi]|uniref:Uncharacterized protein n=1 Tax=Diaporthe helianthi TaxID=158607 RepID=A0A2P5HSH1_DIAHE|nr:hypothetical protein DHEL01_v208405 [Diaporthe helianthi]
MRPGTPKEIRLPSQVGPSSPPQTPTATSHPPFFGQKNSPRASPGPSSGPRDPLTRPRRFTPFENCQFNFAFTNRHGELSPRSSGPPAEGSEADQSDDDHGPCSPLLSSPPGLATTEPFGLHANIMASDEISIEELSDFEEYDMGGRDNVLEPHLIEYAGSDPSESHIEGHVINDFRDLNFRSPDPDPLSDSSDVSDDEHQEAIRRQRAYDRQKRRSISSMGKRTMSERSDSDHEDVRHCLDFEQAGSSARRLKRRIGDRRSLIFQDPPPKIDEIDEPPEEMEDTERLAKELPFYSYMTMEVDSP